MYENWWGDTPERVSSRGSPKFLETSSTEYDPRPALPSNVSPRVPYRDRFMFLFSNISQIYLDTFCSFYHSLFPPQTWVLRLGTGGWRAGVARRTDSFGPDRQGPDWAGRTRTFGESSNPS